MSDSKLNDDNEWSELNDEDIECSDSELNDEYPGDEYVVWVEQTFRGGVQCDPESNYVPPDTEKLLQSQCIAVFETDIAHNVICSACGCHSYAAVHYALIHIDNVEMAEEIGFELSDSPHREE